MQFWVGPQVGLLSGYSQRIHLTVKSYMSLQPFAIYGPLMSPKNG